jgi:DNA integrity scanning protein DisA with diadenylate cyclase activity
MTTASALYEIYKTLPKQSRKEFKTLIESEEENSVLLSEIKEGLKQVKGIREGKIKAKNIKDVLNG